MDLKVPIKICDELSDSIVAATGLLDLASGEIQRIEYQDYDLAESGPPFESDEYEFTSGTLSHHGKEVEFSIHVNHVTGQYSVSASELLEIKVRAAALFTGTAVQGLLDHVDPQSPVKPAKPAPGSAKPRAGKARPGR